MSGDLALIVSETAREFGVEETEIMSARRQRGLIVPRHTAMYLSRQLTTFSLPMIGRHFGRDHTTIMHAAKAVERRFISDQDYHEKVTTLAGKLLPLVGRKDYLRFRIDEACEKFTREIQRRANENPAAVIAWLEKFGDD